MTATTDSKTYDGTTNSSALATVNGTIAGDTFTNASLAQSFNSSHVLGSGNSTVNVSNALTNASFASNTAGSLITDYAVTYCTTAATITAKTLTVTAATDTKTYDGTIGSNLTPTVNGGIAGDTFNTSNLDQVFNSSHALGANASTLTARGTVAIGNSTAGSLITDYTLSFANATGTITPANLTVTATTGTKAYDGTTSSTSLATVSGNISGDTFTNASLAEIYNSTHALGTNNSTLNVAAALTNASFATNGGIAGLVNTSNAPLSRSASVISDYNITYVSTQGTITPAALTVTANTDSKIYDGTTSSTVLATVTGNIAGDTFTNASLAQAFTSSHALGTNNSTLNVATALTNASFAVNHGCSGIGLSCSVGVAPITGSVIGDYNITYVTAQGTITPGAT